MSCIVIFIDGQKIPILPDSFAWERTIRGKDGNYAAIYNPLHRLRMSSGVLTGVYHQELFAFMDSQSHTITVPHPSTGVLTDFTGFVDLVTGRQSAKGGTLAMAGFDIECSGIEVTY